MLQQFSNVFLLVVAQIFLHTPCCAQVFNDSTVQNCQTPIPAIANGKFPINSTGTARLAPSAAHDEPWYLSLTITDRRDPRLIYGGSATWQQLEGFLSIPSSLAGSRGGNQTEYCMFMLPSQDAASQAEAGDCGGVLSEECLHALLYNTPSMWDGRCHKPSNLEDACGTFAPLVPSSPSNFSSTECTLTGLPHIDLPEGYRTYGNLPVSVLHGGDDRENFDLFDKNVRQAVPMLFTIKSSNGTVENKAVCLAPNNVVEGSRVPESAAIRVSSGHPLVPAVVAIALVSIWSLDW